MNPVLLGALGQYVLLGVVDCRHVVEDEAGPPLEKIHVFAIFDLEDGLPSDGIGEDSFGLRTQTTCRSDQQVVETASGEKHLRKTTLQSSLV